MNKFCKICKSIYGKILLPACLIHTFITFLMMWISDFDAIQINRAGLVFLFSLTVAFSNRIFDLKKMNILLRATLHFIFMTLSFVIFMLYGSGNFSKNSSGSMLLLVVYVVIYLLIAPVFVYLIYRKEKKMIQEVEYQRIYS